MTSVLPDPSTEFGARVARRLADEVVAWLTVVDGAGHAVLPGLHNVHLHSGLLLFEIQEGEGPATVKREMRPGERVHITPKTIHRMTAIEDSDIFEVSTPEIHDVVRLEDRYGRKDGQT